MSRSSVAGVRSSDRCGWSAPALLAALLVAGLAGPAAGDERVVHGRSLVLSVNQDGATTIEVDPSLTDAVRIVTDRQSCFTVLGAGSVIVAHKKSCEDDDTLTVAVPPRMAIVLSATGDGEVNLGDTHGSLVASLEGDGPLHIGDVANLVLSIHGDGDAEANSVAGSAIVSLVGGGNVTLHGLTGALTTKQTGSGDLTVDHIDSSQAVFQIEGSGNAQIASGTIAHLVVHNTASGDLKIDATVHDADLVASGSGDIRLAQVNGQLRRETTGSGSVSVGGTHVETEGVGSFPPIPPIPPIPALDIPGLGGRHVTVIRSSGAGHLFAGLLVVGLLFFIWRTIHRAGGLAAMRNRIGSPRSPASPNHPGVLALQETIRRLEARLARVESYVTSREFDLQRKFREMDAQK